MRMVSLAADVVLISTCTKKFTVIRFTIWAHLTSHKLTRYLCFQLLFAEEKPEKFNLVLSSALFFTRVVNISHIDTLQSV